MRISNVALVVPDYDDGIAFYCDVLGFVLLEDTDLGGGKRWVRVATSASDVALLLAKASNAAQRAAIGNQTGGRVGFFLEVNDFEEFYERLLRRGVTFTESPRVEAYGKVVVFRDPFGNLWDLIEPSPRHS